jgi:6-phosphofructokinase 1
MAAKKALTIGILTGGGDVPGLNPCIREVVYRGVEEGLRIVGIRRGWAGLLEFNPDDPESKALNIVDLDKAKVRTIDRSGGTYLHTSRTNPGKVKYENVPEFLKEQAKEDELNEEGFPAVAIPKTMDNDVHGTDYCIGFSTAVTRSVNFIHSLRTSTGSHERIAVIELFGRYCGETSLIAAYLASVDRAIISEVPFDPEKLARFIMEDKRANPSNYAMLTISEGAKMVSGEMMITGEADAYGHRKLGGIGMQTGEVLKKLTGQNIIYQQLSYLMRSGAPDSLDLMVAVNYANMAIDLVLKKVSGRMVALSQGTYTDVPMSTITAGQKRVDVRELYDAEQYRPKVRHVMGKPMFLY